MSDSSGEFAFIEWVRRRTRNDSRVLIGPGDDAAALLLSGDSPCLVTTDMLLEGSCFRLAEAGARLVGRKAMAVNLSDIAAMAGRPLAALISVGLPHDGGRALAEELYLGLRDLADGFETTLLAVDTPRPYLPQPMRVIEHSRLTSASFSAPSTEILSVQEF